LVVVPHGSLIGYRKAYSVHRRGWVHVLYDFATLRATTRLAAAVVVTSSLEEKDALEFGIPKNKIVRIPYGLSLPPCDVAKQRPRGRDARVVLTVSRLTAKNNLEFLMRGFARALRRRANLRLVIVGGAKPSGLSPEEGQYYQRLQRLASELQIKESVTFAGWKVGEELWGQYRAADVFAWTSRYDNFARALVEAAWFGLPIVSTPVGIAPELLADNSGGRLVEHDDEEALAAALIDFTGRRIDAAIDGQRNREKAAEYTLDRMVSGYIELYKRVDASGWW